MTHTLTLCQPCCCGAYRGHQMLTGYTIHAVHCDGCGRLADGALVRIR
jgi:hypothetical protein